MNGPGRAVQIRWIRAVCAALAGSVLGLFHLLPLMAGYVGHASGSVWLLWVTPILGAGAAAVWAWHSPFGCRLVGLCTLLTSLLVLFGMLLLPLILEAPHPALVIVLPIGVAAVGMLTLALGSSKLERVRESAWRSHRA